MMGSRYSLHNNSPIVYRKSVVSAITDLVEDSIDVVYEAQKDVFQTLEDVSKDILTTTVELSTYTNANVINLLNDIGLSDSFSSFLRDMDAGLDYLAANAIEGDVKSIATVAVLAVSIYFTFGGSAAAIGIGGSSAAASLGVVSYGITGSYLVGQAVYYSYLIYSVYGLLIPVAELGAILAAGGLTTLLNQLGIMKDAMNLAFTNMWINGSMSLWMAGGILYDSPKAGDVLFNPTGDLNTTRFLNIQNKNTNLWMEWNAGKYHEFHKKVFGNLAGEEFFSVSPIAQRMA